MYTLAASLADEARFNVRKPHVVGPLVGCHCDRVRASVVGAVDQEASRAAFGPHFAEGDFLRTHGHMIPRPSTACKLSILWGVRNGRELLCAGQRKKPRRDAGAFRISSPG